jgi:hypothetical protein
MPARRRRRRCCWSAALVAVAGACSGVEDSSERPTGSGGPAEDVPIFRYDPGWPAAPLADDWILGEIGGIDVDVRGHVWVIQRPWTVSGRELGAVDGSAACCRPAPPVIELDAEGRVVQAWPALRSFFAPPGTAAGQGNEIGGRGETLWEADDGPGYGSWGRREHTVYVDHLDFVWVTLDESHVVYKLTREGRHLLTIGEHGVTGGSNDTARLGRPAGLVVDPETNELFVADGYTNKRVIVFDAESGAYRRHWGAYGNVPEDVQLAFDPDGDPPRQFVGPVHGIDLSRDGLVYVTDRSANRVQVFRRDGTFVREAFVARSTRDLGSAYGVALSPDPEQRWAYVNDGSNNVVWVLRRSDLEVVGSFSSYGRQGGQVMSAHSIAVDADGNVYVGETRGRRVQRFVQ